MNYPSLLTFQHEDEFRDHYNLVYCKEPIVTYDGISVRFRRSDFLHLCKQDDDKDGVREAFAWNRAERLDWIKCALQDENAELYFGWLTAKKRVLLDRRVALVQNNYAVTIQLTEKRQATVVTAFLLTTPAVRAMRQDPIWDETLAEWPKKYR